MRALRANIDESAAAANLQLRPRHPPWAMLGIPRTNSIAVVRMKRFIFGLSSPRLIGIWPRSLES